MPDDESKNVTVQLTGLAMSITAGSARLSTSASGGLMFTAAARQLAASARALDDATIAAGLDRSAFDQRAGELMAASLGATLTAYLSVESAVNELLLAHSLGQIGNFKGLDPKMARAFSDAWEAGAHKLNALEKADRVAVMAGAGKMKFGEGPAQQARALHDLRNELVHHKPKVVEHGGLPHESGDKLERMLSPYFPQATIWMPVGSAPFRWGGCLGAGCATWACTVADGFIRLVYGSVGAEFAMPPYR
jgi:hypothetical protein